MTELPDNTKVENWTNKIITFRDPVLDLSFDIPLEKGAPAYVYPKYVQKDGSRYITETIWSVPDKALPARRPGVYLIVSKIVKIALPDRSDLVVPADIIKGLNDEPIACRRFTI